MSGNLRAQQKLAERLASAFRRFEHEGGCLDDLAASVGETSRDLRRWADGTKMPAHVLAMLLGELPRHLADDLIRPTGLRLISRNGDESANALLVAAAASGFVAAVAERHADGKFCHIDEAMTREDAKRLIAVLQPIAGE
jgi:hypothetical protein